MKPLAKFFILLRGWVDNSPALPVSAAVRENLHAADFFLDSSHDSRSDCDARHDAIRYLAVVIYSDRSVQLNQRRPHIARSAARKRVFSAEPAHCEISLEKTLPLFLHMIIAND
jgi:hypothetical protein